MPTEAIFEVHKGRAIKNANDLLAESTRLLDDAEGIVKAAEDENRMPTEDESRQFTVLVEESEALKKQYDEVLLADTRAAQRAALETVRSAVRQTPSAAQILNRGVLSRVGHIHDRILDDPRRGFLHMGDFCASIYQAGMPGTLQMDERLIRIGAAATGMQQAQGSQGGFAVPPMFSTQIWDGLNTAPDNLMSLCDTYTVTGESLTFPANAETSRATGSRYGGVAAYWIAEATQITSSRPTLRQMKLEPQELAALVYVTDKLLRNASALEAYVRRAAGEEIMFLVNNAIITGTGVGQPLGVLNAGCLITVSKETGQQATTLELENINKMYARQHVRSRGGAVWFHNQDVEPELEGLQVITGTGGFPVYLSAPTGFPNAAEAPQSRLKGKPTRAIEYCKTLGTVGDILFLNLQYYALGLQGGLNEAMSMHLRFDYAETAFRFMFAVDGRPWLASALTPFNGSNTLSPFVALETRS